MTDLRWSKGKPGANGECLTIEEQNRRIREGYYLSGIKAPKAEKAKRLREIYAGTLANAHK